MSKSEQSEAKVESIRDVLRRTAAAARRSDEMPNVNRQKSKFEQTKKALNQRVVSQGALPPECAASR